MQPERYHHYTGVEYQVIDVAIHSETKEEMVVYRPLYSERRLWIRPLHMFTGQVLIEGKLTPRFLFLQE